MKKVTILIFGFLFALSSLASVREERNIGLYLGVGTPMHGGAGGGLLINATDWLRITGEISYQTNETDKVMDHFGSSMMAAMFWIILLGQTDYDDIYNFLNPEDPNFQRQSVLASAAGLELLWPTGAEWAPMIGASSAKYSQENGFHDFTEETGAYMLYKLGLDYQSKQGFHFSVGGTYAPQLPEPIQRGGYMRLGFAF